MAIKEHFEGKRDLGLIDPRKLTVDPDYNVRNLEKPEARESLDYLKSLIRTTGVQTALRIREDGDGKLIIVRGHRRHKVVMELIEEGHPVKLVPVTQEPRGTTPADRNWDLIDSNSEEPLKGFERADALYRQIHVFGWDEKEILRRTGKTQTWLNQQLELRTVAPEAKKMVDDGVASISTVRQATKEHGDKAVDVLKEAATHAPTTGKKAGRVTTTAVRKATGKRPQASQDKDNLLNFVSVAGKIADEAKRAGGIEWVPPEKLRALATETVNTLAKAKGEKVTPIPDAADETDRALFDEQNEGTAAAPPAADLPSALAATSETEITEGDAEAELIRQRQHEDRPAAPAARRMNTRVDELLLEFISVERVDLAAMLANLNKEYDNDNGIGQATEAQEILIGVCDGIGVLRFPEEWESAKATSELAMVA